MFDWITFLRRHRIDYVTRGPSTSRNNVNVHCPLCGDSDSGHHLGISLLGKGWHCWRNESHSGKSRARLIQLLLRCDEATAKELAGGERSPTPLNDNSFLNAFQQRFQNPETMRPRPLKLLPEFKPLVSGGVFVKPFLSYLQKRGYSNVNWLYETYNLHWCQKGPFAWRIIIPVYDQWGTLQTWTGRTIRTHEELRYRALGMRPTDSLPAAKYQPQDTLLGLPYLWHVSDPKVLLIAEGPFDAMWLTSWGKSFGVYATCLFGLNLSQQQMVLISALQERFEKTYLLLDRGAAMRAFRLATSGLSLPIKRIDTAKDPAELTPEQASSFCVSCLP